MSELGPFVDKFLLPNEDMDAKLFNIDDGSTFSIGNAIHMLRHANLAYFTEEEIKKSLALHGYECVYLTAKEGIYEPQGFFAYNEKVAILCFRGTEPTNFNDWLTDLSLLKTQFVWGQVHTGFYKSIDLLWPQIKEVLEKYYYGKPNKLFVTGHSLGAAMATVGAARIEAELLMHPVSVYTFGSPRVFDQMAANTYNAIMGSRTFRIVNNNDVVTDIPFEMMGFSHVGSFKYLDTNGMLKTDPSWWYLLLDGAFGAITDIGDFDLDMLEDHCTTCYLDALKKNL